MTLPVVDLGAVDEFEPGQAYSFTIGKRPVMLVRHGDDFFALLDTCPHQGARLSDGCVTGTTLKCRVGGPLTYGRAGELVRCPWHGWQFELESGRSLFDPMKTRVRTFPVQVVNDRVLMEISR